jgi:hypothetical protein
MHRPIRVTSHLIFLFVFLCVSSIWGVASAPAAERAKKGKTPALSPVALAARQYAEAVSTGDRAAVGRLDFGCLYRLVAGASKRVTSLPAPSDRYYSDCWSHISEAHQKAIEHQDRGVYAIWPGKQGLVFFTEELTEYVPSFFVMDQLGLSPPGTGLRLDVRDTKRLPAASFRVAENAPVIEAPTSVVRMKVIYKDPLTSPIAFKPGLMMKFTNVIRSPKQVLKSVTVRWVVLTGLRRLGFPVDAAVLNLPGTLSDGSSVPFVTERGGYEPESAAWWVPSDTDGLLLAAVGQALKYPEQPDRIALLNRVVLLDPFQPEALTALSRELYQTVLNMGATAHRVSLGDRALAARFNELYWDGYSMTVRTDISLGMEMGGRLGLSQPTAADYLYRMFPPMEKLAKIHPQDLENRLRLGMAYRWNNDQLTAIETHEALLKDVRPELPAFKARVLTELAWSRIARVAWNRTFDDPGLIQAYNEAEEALNLTTNALDKFTAAYTMAYSLAFSPQRDNKAMLQLLTDAHHWYKRLPGASQESWLYLLGNDTLKPVVSADPAFKPLLAAS